ncbi:hypothetical protein N7478_004613 [Penicillium angulare]|uniref:uncharacterized protein n=1 Tax=Penicillium angulare TaxID=116970 RepID=UPI002540B36C|nr:uncharacterized protein N7478_004613 [Penicillium angulare]KAJ5279241.1 hypothetical protein N7478_004613 [Penicillium angulare]
MHDIIPSPRSTVADAPLPARPMETSFPHGGLALGYQIGSTKNVTREAAQQSNQSERTAAAHFAV